jgi:hypothetical protein
MSCPAPSATDLLDLAELLDQEPDLLASPRHALGLFLIVTKAVLDDFGG